MDEMEYVIKVTRRDLSNHHRNVAMLVRRDEDGKYYSYDSMKIKKDTSNLFQSNDLTQ